MTGADFTDAEVASNVGVADSALDDDAPEPLHQAQGTTLTDREQRRQERMEQEHATQDDSYIPTAQ